MDRRKFLQGTAAAAGTAVAAKAGLLKGASPAAEADAPVAEAAASPLYHLKHTATGNTGAAYNGWLDDYSQGHTFTDDSKMADLLKKHIGNVHPSKHSEVISPKNYEIDKALVDTDNLKLIDLDKPLADQPPDIQAIFRKEGEYFQKHLTPSELLSGRDYEGVNLNKLGYDGTIHRPFKLKHDLIQSDIDWHKARMEEGDYTGKKLETVKKKIMKWERQLDEIGETKEYKVYKVFNEDMDQTGSKTLPPSLTKSAAPEELHAQSTQKLLQEAQAARQAGVPIPKEIQAEIDEAIAEAAPRDMGKSKLLDSLRALVRPTAMAAQQAVQNDPAVKAVEAIPHEIAAPAAPIKQMPLLQPPPKPLEGDNHNPYEGL